MENNNKISVAMTTYNGEKYVAKQLESIICQTRLPDEVIICDDGSSDATIEIINGFIGKYQLCNWKLMKNCINAGWRHNFFKAASLTSGDIIFFADQDDIWCEDKIEMMSDLMIRHEMGCLYAEKQIIDSDDNLFKERQDKKVFTGNLFRIPLKNSFYELTTLGCCMCVSRSLLKLYLELNFPEGGHDSQCGRLAVLMSSLWYLDFPVIKYRIHNQNTSGISSIASYGQSDKQTRIDDISVSILWIKRLLAKFNLDDMKYELLRNCLNFQCKRLDFLRGKSSFLFLVCNYKYYRDFTMFIGDLAYKYNLNKKLGLIRWYLNKLG